ncbi:MAG TPA: hypothetical protein DCY13_17435, partial [Verrucomicrobiales bacterium]|nr:hypothetical protein [Verrucomicrobiales bacterium]
MNKPRLASCHTAFILPGLLAIHLVAATELHAASHTWSGAVNGLFSNPGNWSAGGVPTLAETNTLVFPVGVARTTVTNDIGALKVAAFNFPGGNYVVRGASTITVQPNLINILCTGGSNTIESPLSFVSVAAITVGTGDTLVLSGMLSGTNGLIQSGAGELYIRGTASNPLSGALAVNSGEVHFQKSGGASPYNGNSISIGSTNVSDQTQLFLHANDQISDGATVSIQPSGALVMNGFSDQVYSVNMLSGIVDAGTGTLGINGSLNLSPRFVGGLTYESPTLLGKLELHGAACTISVSGNTCSIDADIVENGTTTTLNKTGPGTLWLKGGGNNPGAINVLEGALRAELAASLGTAAGNTTVASGATLTLGGGITTSESLVLSNNSTVGIASGVVSVFGNMSLPGGEATVDVPVAGYQLLLNGVVSGLGGLRKIGDGELMIAGNTTNTFTGASTVARGRIHLNKPANVRSIASVTVTNGAELRLAANELIDNAGILSLYSGAIVNLINRDETIGGLNIGSGQTLDTGTGTLTLLGNIYSGPPYSTNGNADAIIRGRLSLGGATRNVASTNGDAVVFDCVISDGAGVGGLNQTSGTMWLLRSNSFSGPVNVSGSCYASNSFAFGAPGGGVFATPAPGYGAAIELAHPTMVVTGETLTCVGNLYLNARGSNAWTGPVALTNGSLFVPSSLSGTQLTLDGSINGNGGLSVQGAGMVRFMQSNGYSGFTDVTGNLAIRHPQGLGTAAQGTQINEGGTLWLELPNGSEVVAESLVIDDIFGTETNAQIAVVGSVTNTWSAPLNLAIPQVPLLVKVLNTNGMLTLNSVITGAGALEKGGPGTLILGGTDANTHTGQTTVSGGTLRLQKPSGVQAAANLTVSSGGRLEWGASEQIANGATLATRYALPSIITANLSGHTETLTHLDLQTSAILEGTSGTLTLLGNIGAQGAFCEFYPTVQLSPGTHDFTLTDSASQAELKFFGPIRESGPGAGLNINGCWVWLMNSNSFTGPVHAAGLDSELRILHPHGLGGSAMGTTVSNNAFIYLDLPNGSVIENESLTVLDAGVPGVTGVAVRVLSPGTNTWNGPVILQHVVASFAMYELDTRLVLSGPISGPGQLWSSGPGTLMLAGTLSNSFSRLEARSGTVRLAKPAGVPALGSDLVIGSSSFASSTVILDAPGQIPAHTLVETRIAGTLDLNGHATTVRGLTGNDGQVLIGTGSLTISNSSADFSQFFGTVTGSSGAINLMKQGAGSQRFQDHSLAGSVWVQGGSLLLGNGSLGALEIDSGTLVDMLGQVNHLGSLAGGGDLWTAGNGMIFVGANNVDTTFSGTIKGSSATNIIKLGTGALTLAGANTDTGRTLVNSGSLIVNGSLAGPVQVNAGGTLRGTGAVGPLAAAGNFARIAPGPGTNSQSHGKLTAASLTLASNAILSIEFTGTNAGVNLDQVEVSGSIALTGGQLELLPSGYGAVSNRYTVVKATDAGSNTGNFTGLAEGGFAVPAAGR